MPLRIGAVAVDFPRRPRGPGRLQRPPLPPDLPLPRRALLHHRGHARPAGPARRPAAQAAHPARPGRPSRRRSDHGRRAGDDGRRRPLARPHGFRRHRSQLRLPRPEGRLAQARRSAHERSRSGPWPRSGRSSPPRPAVRSRSSCGAPSRAPTRATRASGRSPAAPSRPGRPRSPSTPGASSRNTPAGPTGASFQQSSANSRTGRSSVRATSPPPPKPCA